LEAPSHQRCPDLFDQAPSVREPKTVLSEIAAAATPDGYLQSLHPKHEQFQRLRKALLKARGSGNAGGKSGRNVVEIERIIINMERWRWMPEDLGRLYVLNNSPEFMLHVVKDGKTIYADKTLVGEISYATPVFSADMETIVFNPDWIAPETVLLENLLPPLRKKEGGGWNAREADLRQNRGLAAGIRRGLGCRRCRPTRRYR
jgi:murein L,D-transpeptidase YcbB/YkuD